MVKLRCGCEVTEQGKFVLGEGCKSSGCAECKAVSELHPFGGKRISNLVFR